MINIHDIVHNLSKEERFMNCLEDDWSVLQHVLLVHKLAEFNDCSDEELYCALHHDDPEAYFADIATPLKELLRDYQKYYFRCAVVIEEKFDISISITDLPNKVEWADKTAMKVEDVLFSIPDSNWHDFDIESFQGLNNIMQGELEEYIKQLRTAKRYQLKQEYLRKHVKLARKLDLKSNKEVA